MRTLLTFMLLAAALWPVLVLAGPFGYEMGQAISGEPDSQTEDGLFYKASPKKLAGWEWVTAYYTHQNGVCAVGAKKGVSGRDAYGLDHRRVADFLIKALTKKYGAFDKRDYLLPGSIWDEPNDWLKAIREGERIYGYTKDDIEGNLRLINVLVAYSGVLITYTFNNYDACKEAALEAALSDL